MSEILQKVLPFAPWMEPASARLPGIRPVAMSDWLIRDEAFAGQMALRDRLIAERPAEVLALDVGARPAAAELLASVIRFLSDQPGYRRQGGRMLRPDGVEVLLDGAHPMAVLGRLCQEDLCLLETRGEEHVLTAAVLCFPASWTLSQKFMRPLTTIHVPVESYDESIARRVQRMFDAIRPGQVLMRANALRYFSADLHHPRKEGDPARHRGPSAPYLRSERQSLLHLPVTGAVVFSIHTYLLRFEDLTDEQKAAFAPHHG